MRLFYHIQFPGTIWFQTFCIAFLIFITACNSADSENGNRKVYIRNEQGKYTLMHNGEPYIIKGASGYTHLKRLREIGGNTIRTWDTLNLSSILDSAQKNHLMVLAGLPMPDSKFLDFFYNNPAKTSKQLRDFTGIVNKYKSHPALLMWCVGNELEFNHQLKYYKFYKVFNNLVSMIHRNDPDHPVTTTMVNLQRKNMFGIKMFTNVDFISINIFGSVNTLRQNLEKYSWFWDGPFLLSEWAIEGPWLKERNAWGAYIEGSSTKKAEQYLKAYEKYIPVENSRLLGSFVFYWGYKQETTHTWFSLFDEKGGETETVGVMEYIWTGKWPKHPAPQINYMLVDKKGALDNIIFKPGLTTRAELSFPKIDTSGIYTIWQLFPEDWYQKNKEKNLKKLKPIQGAIIAASLSSAEFITPMKEGPYRIFATIYDKNGNFATSNTPFYVVSN